MNKQIPLMDLDIDMQTSFVKEILQVHSPAYMPIGVYTADTEQLKHNFTSWWRDRAIPATRKLIREKLRELQLTDMSELVNRSFGLSLSDQYWIKPLGESIRWEEINFFQNPFSTDMGEYLSDERELSDADALIQAHSPDITTDGDVQKRWIIENGHRFLLKNGATAFQQEPFNEVIATMVLRHFDVAYVPYTLLRQGGSVYSKCPCFVTPNTEYVTAYNLCKDFAQPGRTLEDTLRLATEHYEIPHVQPFIDQLICLDYLIMNEDRHWSNFGFIRNVDTLRFEGPAPIFDNGNSLWYKIPNHIPEHYDHSLLFRRKHEKELRLLQTVPPIDFTALQSIPQKAEALLLTAPYITPKRAHMIASHLEDRLQLLMHALEKTNQP